MDSRVEVNEYDEYDYENSSQYELECECEAMTE